MSPPDLQWAELLKAKRNPLLASKPSQQSVNNLAWGLGGASAAAGFNLLVTDKLPKPWHLPVHGGLAFASLFAPHSPLTAGIGGALFYAFISETYNSLLKK